MKDFRYFCYVVLQAMWGVAPTRVQYDIANEMQLTVLSGMPSRLMVQAQRGEGKSVFASLLTCWINYWWPAKKIFVVSASEKRAVGFTTFTMTLLREIPFLNFLMPDVRLGDRMSAMAYDLRGAPKGHDPSVKAVGVMGQMAGSHADVIIPDDIEIPNNSDTPTAREKLKERTKELEAIGNPGHRQIWLGTPQSEDTVYQVLPSRGVKVLVWPGQYPGCDEFPIEHYEGTLATTLREDLLKDPTLVGKPTDPERFPENILQEKRATYGLAGYSLQFMLDATLSDNAKQPLRLRDLVVADITPESVPTRVVWCNDSSKIITDIPSLGKDGDFMFRPMQYSDTWKKCTRVVLSVDQSGAGEDETAWAAVGELDGLYFLFGIGGFRDGGLDALDGLAEVGIRYNCRELLIESNFGGQTFGEALQSRFIDQGHPIALTDVRATAQKELRIIRSLEPVLASHRLVVSAQALRDDYDQAKAYAGEAWPVRSLMHQMTRLTRDRGSLKHDDRVDALAQGIAHFGGLALSTNERDSRAKVREERQKSLGKLTVLVEGRQRNQKPGLGNKAMRMMRGL